MQKTMSDWLDLAEDRLKGTGIQVLFAPGNDDPFFIDEMLASSDQSVSVSSDLGLTWRKLDAQGLFDAAISCQGSVLLATASRLMFAPPGKAPEASQGIPEGTVSAVVFHPLRCQEAYAAQFGKLYRSSDAGAHWNPVEGVTSLSSISRFWLTDATPDWLFATVPGSGIFRQRLP